MTQVTDPGAWRRVPVGAIGTLRDCVRLPAVRLEAGWQVQLSTRGWFTLVGEPVLLGDSQDPDGGQVQLLLTGPGTEGTVRHVFRRGERLWARAPQPETVPAIGCVNPDCANDGPFLMTERGLMYEGCAADHALAETAGPDTPEEAGRG
jgi:hypothetical protein